MPSPSAPAGVSAAPQANAPQANDSRTAKWPFAARFLLLNFGLALYGFGLSCMISAHVGLTPWDALHVGLSQRLPGVAVGTASILVGAFCQAGAALWLKMPVGLGSVLNMVLIGVYINVLLPLLPKQSGADALSWGVFLLGIVLVGLATGTYIASHFGAGPRDSLALGIARRYEWPIRSVRTGIELAALAVGFSLGAKTGWGTLVFALLVGPAMQGGMRLWGLRR